ncbi:hypothetical protein CY35_01G175500 [Sphagnum magellanicum]|nr:hypothetical protein CY35_01G175500 [Sphagnum magellanicum]
MPQLDQFTYLTQFVWLCVFYTTLYVLLYSDGLPKISRILKLREQLISHQNVGTELSNYSVEHDVLFQECFDTTTKNAHTLNRNKKTHYLVLSQKAHKRTIDRLLNIDHSPQICGLHHEVTYQIASLKLHEIASFPKELQKLSTQSKKKKIQYTNLIDSLEILGPYNLSTEHSSQK